LQKYNILNACIKIIQQQGLEILYEKADIIEMDVKKLFKPNKVTK